MEWHGGHFAGTEEVLSPKVNLCEFWQRYEVAGQVSCPLLVTTVFTEADKQMSARLIRTDVSHLYQRDPA